jgi:hypothetical protein
MATLTERLIELDKIENTVKRDKPTSVVYAQRSGSKDITTKWQIGGKFSNIKKVARQPLQIYAGEEFLKNINKNRETIKSQFVNPTRMPKIENKDVRTATNEFINKYLGMVLMGGTVGKFEESGKIQKIEEMKLNKMTFLQEDI